MIHNIDRICINCMKEKADRDAVCPFCGYDPKIYQPASTHLAPFTILYGKYLLGRVIGQGGFGIVYIALDLVLEIVVAIKELFPARMVTRTITNQSSSNTVSCTDDPRNLAVIREKFVKEARTIIRLQEQFNAEGIVQVRDLFEDNNTVYLVMEYLQGKSLKQYCEENGTIRYQQLLRMLRPIMDSLELMHKVNILHRDISADNIMVLSSSHRESAEDVPQLKLLDFGNVKVQDSANDVSRSMVMAVKKGYSPIEQYSSEGQIGPWTDIYALCATIYYCLTGKLPPEPAVLSGTTITLPSRLGTVIPDSAEETLMKGLAFRHSDRIQNMHDLIAGLYDAVLEHDIVSDQHGDPESGKENTQEKTINRKRKHPFMIGIPLGIILSIFGVGFFNTYHREQDNVIQTESLNTVDPAAQFLNDKKASENAIRVIKNLPDPISLNDEESVKSAREVYDNLTESQKKRVHHILTSKLIHCEEDIKLLKSKETEDEVSVDPDSLKKDDFYLVSDDPDSFFYGENDALSELDDGWFWYYPSVDKDKYYTITTKRGISNDFPKKKDIINQYGTGVVIPIDTSKDYAYQTFQEGGPLEAEIIEKSKECIFYNYKDQGQIVFYVNDSGLCDMIIIQSGIFFHADKATVKRVQGKLNLIGYECGKVDGVEGKKTHNAVKKYQEDNGLYPSGIIDDSLLKSLEL